MLFDIPNELIPYVRISKEQGLVCSDELSEELMPIFEKVKKDYADIEIVSLDELEQPLIKFRKEARKKYDEEQAEFWKECNKIIGIESSNALAAEHGNNRMDEITRDVIDEMFFKKKHHDIYSGLTSQEATLLKQVGVNRVYLDDCHETNRQAVVNAVVKMLTNHPELMGQVTEINCHSMKDGIYASTHFDTNFDGVIDINSDYFSNPNLDANLKEKSRLGWFISNASCESVIEHELGHGMHLELCTFYWGKYCGYKDGLIHNIPIYDRAIHEYMDDKPADSIVEKACCSLNIEFDSWDFSRQLSKYGGSSYREAIAEAVSEVENNVNPRPLASAIYRELLSYRQEEYRKSLLRQ